ncbi:hypothetical protein BS78_01G084800 [Paspalum vaginatum]|nr:hypothetical protein BS78_01G084800 [Paspalum vaginatum]
MDPEAFPVRFTKGIRSYWRRHVCQPATGGRGSRRRHGLVRLGDGSGSGARPWAVRIHGIVRRAQPPAPSRATHVSRAPLRVLGRIRNAYVDVMLGAARPPPAAARALPGTADALWRKRVPVRRSSGQQQTQH